MVPQAVKRLMLRYWPELGQRHHVPQLARIEAVHDMPQGGAAVSTPFRAYKAADVQLLDRYGNPRDVPLFEQVTLAISVNPHESGLYCEPRPGMRCLIQYIDGLESLPVITHVLPWEQSVADVRSTDVVLQQNHRSKLTGTNGDWHMQTDGEITRSSQRSQISAQHREERFHERSVAISAHESKQITGNQITEVMGALKMLVGEKALISSLDSLLLGSKSTIEAKAHDNMHLETLKTLHAKAAELAKMEGTTVWVGDASVNAVRVLLDLCALVESMNNTLKTHTHKPDGLPVPESTLGGYESDAKGLKDELEPITEQV